MTRFIRGDVEIVESALSALFFFPLLPQLSKWKSSRRGKKGRGHRDPSASCVGDRYVSQLIFPHWPEVRYICVLTQKLTCFNERYSALCRKAAIKYFPRLLPNVKLLFLILQVGPPLPAADLLAFVKAAFSCRQAAGGRVFVHSRVGLDSCLLYATLETMLAQGYKDAAIPLYLSHRNYSYIVFDWKRRSLRIKSLTSCCCFSFCNPQLHWYYGGAFQIRYHGDVNIPNYSRHLSAAHGHALASADLYVYVMTVAF